MRKTTIILLLTMMIFSSCQKQRDAKAIETVFENFKTSLTNNAPKDSILNYFDQESMNHLIDFEKVLQTKDMKQINAFCQKTEAPYTWKYLAYTLIKLAESLYSSDSINPSMTITLFSLAAIPVFDPSQIQHFNFNEIVEQNEYKAIAKIRIEKHFENAKTKRDVAVNTKFVFRKEKDGWKINIISYFKLFDKVLLQNADAANQPIQNFLYNMTHN